MLVVYADLAEDVGVVEGRFAEGVVASGGSSMARRHVRLEEERVLVGLQGSELRDVLRGFPDSSNSPTVRGSDSSSMVLITSTNGTLETTALKRSGRRFATAPMRRPPALPPSMTRRSGEVHFSAIRCSAAAMKSVKVFIFFIIRPSSCQALPISPPPRTWASAIAKPRSSKLTRFEEKVIGSGNP